MPGNGLIYTATFQGTAAAQAQNLWEITTAANYGMLIHSILIEFAPKITSGVAQDVRANILLAPLLTTGSGGIAITAAAGHPRNTLAAKTSFTALVSAPGAIGPAIISINRSIINPMEFLSPAERDRGIEIAGGAAMAVALTNPLQAAYTVSSVITFEEF